MRETHDPGSISTELETHSPEPTSYFERTGRKVVEFTVGKPPMKTVRIMNNQVQSVRIVYKETDTTIELEIWPRVNFEGPNSKPMGDLLSPGKTMEISGT